jgi:hypothetical protein
MGGVIAFRPTAATIRSASWRRWASCADHRTATRLPPDPSTPTTIGGFFSHVLSPVTMARKPRATPVAARFSRPSFAQSSVPRFSSICCRLTYPPGRPDTHASTAIRPCFSRYQPTAATQTRWLTLFDLTRGRATNGRCRHARRRDRTRLDRQCSRRDAPNNVPPGTR